MESIRILLTQIRSNKKPKIKTREKNWIKLGETVEVEFGGKINLKIWPDEISKEIIHAKSMTEDTKSLFGLILDNLETFAACSSTKMNFNMKVAVIVLFITKATIRNSKQKQTY